MSDWFSEILGRKIHGDKCRQERYISLYADLWSPTRLKAGQRGARHANLDNIRAVPICLRASNEPLPVFSLTSCDLDGSVNICS